MSFRLLSDEGARSDLADLPDRVRARIAARIDALAGNPTPPNSAALAGNLQGLRRIRVGVYRVVYSVDPLEKTVTVWGVEERTKVYDLVARRVRR